MDSVERSPAHRDLSELVRALRAKLRSLQSMLQARPAAELLSKRQTARILGIGRDTFQRLLACGQMKTTPWAESVKVSRDAIERVKRNGVHRRLAMQETTRVESSAPAMQAVTADGRGADR